MGSGKRARHRIGGPLSDAAAGRLSGARGLIEVVEWAQPCEFAWSSVTGVDQRGRFRLRQIAAPTVRGHLRRSLQQLKRLVEHEQLRELAATRRAARTG
jgi:hypothetical protein